MHFFRQRPGLWPSMLALCFSIAMSAVSALAQTETGQIIGKVQDPNGALVPNAQVTVRAVDTGLERNTTTNSEGGYVAANLLPGLYEVKVKATGFGESKQRVQVTVGAVVSLQTNLAINAVDVGTVDIVATSGVAVNTANQELSNVVNFNQVRELPTITRNPYDLVGLSGNASGVSAGPGAAATGRGAGFAINGQRSASTNILLDGGENVDTFRATVGQSVPLDSVQEFRVVTSNFSAEYGRASGGIVNVTTRAGTNSFHGSAYEFNRVSRLASNGFARNARGLRRGVFTRNQFGYALGGRIIEDKLFFFSSTEWTRIRSTGPALALVPTSQLIAASAAATRNFFSGAQLDAQATGRVFTVADVISSVGATQFGAGNAFAALAGTTPAFQEVSYTVPQDFGGGVPQNTYQTVNRIDWNLSERTQLYGRYALEDQGFFRTTSVSPYRGFATAQKRFNQNYLINATHTFSSNFVSQGKVVYNRLNDLTPLGDNPETPTLYMRTATTAIAGTNVAFPGYLPFAPGTAIPFGGPQNLLQLYQDNNWTKGKHQLRLGGAYVYIQDNRSFGAFQNSVQTLGANEGQALNNFIQGQLLQFQGVIDGQGKFFPNEVINLPAKAPSFSRSNRYHEYAAYANDSWRMRSNLTVNLGVRYEWYGVQRNNRQELDSNFYYGQGSSYAEQVRSGRVFVAQDSPVGGLWRKDNNNWAPRVGFAWDLTGDGKTSVRGGYGMAYERNFGNVTFNVIQNPPAQAGLVIVAGSTPGFTTLPIYTNNLGPLAGNSGTVRLPGRLNVRHVDQNIRNAYTHFWSGAFQRQISNGTVVSVEYSGSAGRNQYTLANPNRFGSGAILLGERLTTAGATLAQQQSFAASTLLNPNYFPLNTRGNLGRSNYNALIVGVESTNFRSTGLQLTANYRYSRTRDNLSTTFSESNNNRNLGLLDPFNPDLDYGWSDFDLRHRFVSGFNWQVPFGKNFNGVARHIVHGWSLNGFLTLQSGAPFTVFDCSRPGANGICYRLVPTGTLEREGRDDRQDPRQTTNRAFANRYNYLDLSNQTPGPFVNPITGTGEWGPFPNEMTRRNEFRAPNFWNGLDFSVHKAFRIKEGMDLQFRSEFYNLFNASNMFVSGTEAQVTNSFGGTTRGVPAFRDGRRQVQLALKLVF